jgi:hypothetical protein
MQFLLIWGIVPQDGLGMGDSDMCNIMLFANRQSWFRFGCYFTPDSEFAWRFPFAVVIIWASCLLSGSFYGMLPLTYAENTVTMLTTNSARESKILGSP